MGHARADHEFGEVVAERGEGQVVEVDDRDTLVGEQEVSDVGVLVEGRGAASTGKGRCRSASRRGPAKSRITRPGDTANG